MKFQDAEQLKAETARMVVTCLCRHPQVGHKHLVRLPDSEFLWNAHEQARERNISHVWAGCSHKGCHCLSFHPMLSGTDKKAMDERLDELVRKQSMAMIMQGASIKLGQRYAFNPSKLNHNEAHVRDGRAALSSTEPRYEARNLRRRDRGEYQKADNAAIERFGKPQREP